MGYRGEKFQKCTFRLPAEVWQKLEWLAQSQGQSRPDLIRSLLAAATANVLKPVDPKSTDIQATPDEWREWLQTLDAMGTDLSSLVRKVMTGAAKKLEQSKEKSQA